MYIHMQMLLKAILKHLIIYVYCNLQERTESSSFTHYDEDSLRLVVDLNDDQKLKYDVEILEPRDVKKETAELEERFR